MFFILLSLWNVYKITEKIASYAWRENDYVEIAMLLFIDALVDSYKSVCSVVKVSGGRKKTVE